VGIFVIGSIGVLMWCVLVVLCLLVIVDLVVLRIMYRFCLFVLMMLVCVSRGSCFGVCVSVFWVVVVVVWIMLLSWLLGIFVVSVVVLDVVCVIDRIVFLIGLLIVV